METNTPYVLTEKVRETKEEYLRLWKLACNHDRIDLLEVNPYFSPDNPHLMEMKAACIQYLNATRAVELHKEQIGKDEFIRLWIQENHEKRIAPSFAT